MKNSKSGNGSKPNAPKVSVPKITPQQNESNMKNANLGTDGVNKQYSKVHGNRGKQLNPNQKKK